MVKLYSVCIVFKSRTWLFCRCKCSAGDTFQFCDLPFVNAFKRAHVTATVATQTSRSTSFHHVYRTICGVGSFQDETLLLKRRQELDSARQGRSANGNTTHVLHLFLLQPNYVLTCSGRTTFHDVCRLIGGVVSFQDVTLLLKRRQELDSARQGRPANGNTTHVLHLFLLQPNYVLTCSPSNTSPPFSQGSTISISATNVINLLYSM